MKNLYFVLFIFFFASGCLAEAKKSHEKKQTPQEQKKQTPQEQKKEANEFVWSKVSELYNDDLRAELYLTSTESGHISEYIYVISSKAEKAQLFTISLLNKKPFEFDKYSFDEKYKSIKINISALKDFGKKVTSFYPNSRIVSRKIIDIKHPIWFIDIYTSEPFKSKDENVFNKLDSLCGLLSTQEMKNKINFSFYFPEVPDIVDHSANRFSFNKTSFTLSADDYSVKKGQKHRYDVTFSDGSNGSNRPAKGEFFDELARYEIENLVESIENWKAKSDYTDWRIKLGQERSKFLDIDQKQFVLENKKGKRKIGFINLNTNNIELKN